MDLDRGKIYTIPSAERIKYLCGGIPDDMGPVDSPYAVVGEGLLTDAYCDALIEELEKAEPYRHEGCDATTRAFAPVPQSFAPICEFTREANLIGWRFNIFAGKPRAWLQTYGPNEGYAHHTDGVLGQSRKLTTVVMLSDPDDYVGGVLRIIPYPEWSDIPNTRGTMVTFPAWMPHAVEPVTHGKRQTINLGYWGQPFR